MIIESRGLRYMVLPDGIHQLDAEPFVYDEKYCSTYDTPAYREGEAKLQAARLGFAIGVHGGRISSILDFGPGNYAFLNAASKVIPQCTGYDVSGVDHPFRTQSISTPVDVVTFHDSLEHTAAPTEVIRSLNCETIIISLPNCPYKEKGAEWFWNNYYHLKPNEHLHHWDVFTLTIFMRSLGWRAVAVSNHEDTVRTRGDWNILSMGFKKL